MTTAPPKITIRYWRAEGRSKAAINRFMADRRRYFAAVREAALRWGFPEQVAYVTLAEQVIGFETAPADAALAHAAGFQPDGSGPRSPLAEIGHGAPRPDRWYPAEESEGLRELGRLWDEHGPRVCAAALNMGLFGEPGPFEIKLPGGSMMMVGGYSIVTLRAGWEISGPAGLPEPHDAVFLFEPGPPRRPSGPGRAGPGL